MKRLLTYLFLVIGLGLVFSVNTNADASFKSALDIDKKEKIRFLTHPGTYFLGSTFLIDDLRGNGPVYYKFFNKDQYYRVDKNFNVISEGTYAVPEDKHLREIIMKGGNDYVCSPKFKEYALKQLKGRSSKFSGAEHYWRELHD